jgi:hypothetical protein
MAAQQIDYTKMRKGTKVSGGRIDVCPKCGRKGSRRHMTSRVAEWDDFIHKSHVELGMFNHVDEHCSVNTVWLDGRKA